jgi:hypothetical protein
MKLSYFIFYLLIVISNIDVNATTFYFENLATHGNGSSESPFSDFSQIQYTLQAGDTLKVRPGTYYISEPIRFRADGTAENPIVIIASDSTDRPYITGPTMIFRIQNNYQEYNGFILDGQYVDHQLISIRDSRNVQVKNCVIHKCMADGIILHNAAKCSILRCEIYYCLAGDFSTQTDAHGVCAMHTRNLLIRDCNIHHVSGDCIQSDPHCDNLDVPLWDSLYIQNCVLWTGNLPEDAGNYKKNQSPGENAIDTKTRPDKDFNTYRPFISIQNVEAYGFINTNGEEYINVRAAFNIKHNVRAEISNCILHDNDVAYRLRGIYTDEPYHFGGAHVIMRNSIGYNNLKNVWFERTIDVAKLYNCTFDKSDDQEYFIYTFGGFNPVGFDLKNCVFVGRMPDNDVELQDDTHFYATWDSSNAVALTSDFRNYTLNEYYPSAVCSFIDKGVDIAGLEYDISGYPRQSGFYDPGAYEYRGELDENPDPVNPLKPWNFDSSDSKWGVLFPNPTSGIIYYYASAPVKRINVFSIEGRLIFSEDYSTISSLNYAIEMASIPKGVYILQVLPVNNAKAKTFKFIKL